ncbi:MAG TPA: TRAM domain-containing protein, partial [Ignavibacteria bacterium]|nr:TRAM domain-containing protein [Ignavibacteria bacterium]
AQKKISLAHNKSLIGKTFKVLIDRKEGDYFIGRTEYDSPEVDNEVYIAANRPPLVPPSRGEIYLRTGDFVDVKIIKAKEYDLEGEVV